MNYIVLNGKKSNTINGLLISTLPPITKPKIRAEVEEIPGRDGDIVTKLGYSAYDKSFEIGLYGHYDVDEVIDYFNTEGTVTFSNEPDKYYKYQTINQIDFEKLIRFKKATVTMHVQPFKYSLVDAFKSLVIEENLFTISNYSRTINGIAVNIEDGEISISGTTTAQTDFYIPINLYLKASNYSLCATSEGQNASSVYMRLIKEHPSDVESFGNDKITLQNNSTVILTADLNEDEEYQYLWMRVAANTSVNVDLNMELVDNTPVNSLIVRNNGNIYAKPKMKITGRGTINIALNGVDMFEIDLDDREYIVIDVAEMEAYKGEILMNRYVNGDYDKFLLLPGKNEISIAGKVSQLDLENFSRWI